MIHVVARAEIKPECMEQYLRIVRGIVPIVLSEEGCIQYEPCVDWSKDGKHGPYVTMLETWASKKHLEAHLATKHMQAFMANVADLRASKSDLQILESALY